MTDLTGAELALAVARAMGRPCGLGELVTGYPHTVTCFSVPTADTALVPLSRYEWRPDQGGAAAWEALEWVRQQGWDVDLRCVELCLDSDEPVTESALCTLRATRPVRECQATGPADAIALCRAVVALGETR